MNSKQQFFSTPYLTSAPLRLSSFSGHFGKEAQVQG